MRAQWREMDLPPLLLPQLTFGLILAGGQVPGEGQIDRLIGAAVMAAERFYPAMQLTCWGDEAPETALNVAIAEAYGRA